MDLPIDLDELDVIIESVSDVDTELCRKLRLVKVWLKMVNLTKKYSVKNMVM